MPGRRNWSRSAVTSGVISPRSSAMKGRAPSSFSTAAKNSAPGPRTHWPALRRRGSRRHVPGRRERAEMIQPDHVHVGQQRAQAVDAPAISALAKRVPVVDGVAPELPVRAEVVGRHARRRPSAGGRCRARTARGWPRRRSSRARRRTADRRSAARPCHARAARDAPPGGTAGTERSERARSGSPALAAPAPAQPGVRRTSSAGQSR